MSDLRKSLLTTQHRSRHGWPRTGSESSTQLNMSTSHASSSRQMVSVRNASAVPSKNSNSSVADKIDRRLRAYLAEYKEGKIRMKDATAGIVRTFRKYGGYKPEDTSNVNNSSSASYSTPLAKPNATAKKIDSVTPKKVDHRKPKDKSTGTKWKVQNELAKLADSDGWVKDTPLRSKRKPKAISRFEESKYERNLVLRSSGHRVPDAIGTTHKTVAKKVRTSIIHQFAQHDQMPIVQSSLTSQVRRSTTGENFIDLHFSMRMTIITYNNEILITTIFTVSEGCDAEGSFERKIERTVTTQTMGK